MSYTVIDAIGNALDGLVALDSGAPWSDSTGKQHLRFSGCCDNHPRETLATFVYERLREENVVLVLQSRLDELITQMDAK